MNHIRNVAREHLEMALDESLRALKKPFKQRNLGTFDAGVIEAWSPEEILGWAIKNYHPRLVLSASFGAPEGMVLLDMMHRIDPGSRVFVLDTGRLHASTHDLIDRVRERYDKRVEVLFPRARDVERMVREKGMNHFYESLENRRLCCRIRKVEPMRRYLAGFDACTGLDLNIKTIGFRIVMNLHYGSSWKFRSRKALWTVSPSSKVTTRNALSPSSSMYPPITHPIIRLRFAADGIS